MYNIYIHITNYVKIHFICFPRKIIAKMGITHKYV